MLVVLAKFLLASTVILKIAGGLYLVNVIFLIYFSFEHVLFHQIKNTLR